MELSFPAYKWVVGNFITSQRVQIVSGFKGRRISFWNSESVQYQLVMRVIIVIKFLHFEEIVRVKIAVRFEMIVIET